MAISDIFLVLIFLTTIPFCLAWKRTSSSLLTNWPLLGMLPSLLQNSGRIHAFITELLSRSNGTFEFKGPWFCNMDMLLTSDPANIHHIFSRNFTNYPKGPEYRKIFEILGDGIFNADFELWELHRRTTLSFLNHQNFYTLLENSVWGKVEKGLIPVLDLVSQQGIHIDLQDVFQRLTFDNICKLVLDYDPESLSIHLPNVPCEKSFNDLIEALLHRHILPETIWKLQKRLGIGKERKLISAWKNFDEFIYPCIPSKEKQNDYNINLLKSFKKAYEERSVSSKETRDFLRDTSLSLMLAGRDTTSTCLTWLFWLIATNPLEESKIREEIATVLNLTKGDKKLKFFTVEESRRLVYLHGALSESLRLYPPVALEHKAPIKPDVLPSGNHIEENTKVIISFYSMGRMESIWGEDCLEFKPERWISAKGGVKHEPSFKFPAFNAGPRTCVGKEMAFIQMKMIAATIIYNYDIQLVKGHSVSPRDSIILQAKDGLKVKLSKRNV